MRLESCVSIGCHLVVGVGLMVAPLELAEDNLAENGTLLHVVQCRCRRQESNELGGVASVVVAACVGLGDVSLIPRSDRGIRVCY